MQVTKTNTVNPKTPKYKILQISCKLFLTKLRFSDFAVLCLLSFEIYFDFSIKEWYKSKVHIFIMRKYLHIIISNCLRRYTVSFLSHHTVGI